MRRGTPDFLSHDNVPSGRQNFSSPGLEGRLFRRFLYVLWLITVMSDPVSILNVSGAN